MPGDYFFLNYGVQDGNVMQGLFRVNKITYQLEVYNGSEWVVANAEGDATATPLTTVQRMAYAPASGALIWDVEEEFLYVGDGVTLGGTPFGSAAVNMTTAQRTVITPRAGMLIWDTTMGNLFIGDGITPGGINTSTSVVRGATNGAFIEDGLIEVDVGTVEEVLTGNTTYDMVDADNLRGALSVGQAVDVSCAPLGEGAGYEFSTDGGTTWNSLTAFNKDGSFLSNFSVRLTNGSSTLGSQWFGWHSATNSLFPKYAAGLKYLWICDVRQVGATPSYASFNGVQAISGIPGGNKTTEWVRIAGIFTSAQIYMYFNPKVTNTTIQMEIKNWRQYEVTALTDEAIAYIARLPDPDAFFRSTSAYSIRDKYLIKQDMVCPFIPTIEMSNSDLTVAAGLSYKMTYTGTTEATRTITADTIPSNGYGWDTHLQLFVNDRTTVNFQSPLVLMNPLTPNAGHNITIKWRNGQALAYVDDTDIGYVVTAISGNTYGTLAYGITNDVGDYIVFSESLDGTTYDLTGYTSSNSASIIGRGQSNTILTGSFNVSNTGALSLINLTVKDMVMTATVSTFGVISGCMLDNVQMDASVTLVTSTPLRANKIIDTTITGTTHTGQWGVSMSEQVINCIYDNNVNNYSICQFISWGTSELKVTGSTFTNNDITSTYAAGKYGVVMFSKDVTIENCYFDNPNLRDTARMFAVYTYTSPSCTISGSTFASPRDSIYIGASTCTCTFSGTNIINSTVSGEGTVAFADGATVTSIIPEGSTIGAGIIKSYMSINSNCTLENVTISTVNDGSHPQNIGIGGACTVNFNNILVTGLTGGIWNNVDGTNIFKCTNVRLTNCDTNVHCWSGLVYYTDCDFGSLDISTSNGVLVLAGEIKANKLYATTGTYTGRIVITPGSIIRLSESYTEDRTVYYVGNYNVPTGSNKVIGTIDITGEASLIINGTTVAISGSGTTIDATGIHGEPAT